MKRLLVRLVLVAVLAGCVLVGAVAARLALLTREVPDLSGLAQYQPPTTSRVFDASGNLVARFWEERRSVVPIEKIPMHVRHAFLAAEDEDFYNHKGIDWFAIVRAVMYQVRHKLIGGPQSGGSTITQQTAKTFLLSPERTFTRKLKEMVLAKQIEERFTKDQILFLYLNQIYFGNGAYGIEEAARTYYGVSVDKLTVGQAAVLASIPKSPSRINPWADPRRVRVRRSYVLGQMKANGFITAEQEAQGNAEPVRIDVAPAEFLDVAPYYAEAIRRTLIERTSAEEVNRGGLTVYAALDARLQKAANRAVQQGLRDLDKRQGWRGPIVRLDPDEAKDFLDVLEDERARRFPPEETPELASQELFEGRPLWDLQDLRVDAVRKVLAAGAHPADGEDEESEWDKRINALLKAQTDKAPPLRAVRTMRGKAGAIVGAVVKNVDNASKFAVVDLGTIDARLPFSSMSWARPFSPEKATEKPRVVGDVLKRGDVVLVKLERAVAASKKAPAYLEVSLEQEPKVEAGFAAVDPNSHRVLALVGGYDFERSSFNRATQAFRQAGSSFKPFIYATGIESRLFSPVGYLEQKDGAWSHRLLTDAPKVFFDRWTGQKWQPKNSGGRFLGDITLRTCLTHSVNTCSISLLEKIGVDPVLDVAARVGLHTPAHPFPQNLTLALGTGEVHPLDIVNAYSIFPAAGRFAPPILIEKIKRPDGSVLEEARPAATQVISPQAAFIASDMMRSVVESGTATRARELGRPVAGKTGTTDEARSVWFVGFTPDLVAGAYVGFDDNAPLGRNESGGRAAVPIWLSFMQDALKELPVTEFEMPDGVVKKSVDAQTGLLAHVDDTLPPGALPPPIQPESVDDDPIPAQLPGGVIAEVFVAGTEPVQTADDAPPPPLELQEQGGLSP